MGRSEVLKKHPPQLLVMDAVMLMLCMMGFDEEDFMVTFDESEASLHITADNTSLQLSFSCQSKLHLNYSPLVLHKLWHELHDDLDDLSDDELEELFKDHLPPDGVASIVNQLSDAGFTTHIAFLESYDETSEMRADVLH